MATASHLIFCRLCVGWPPYDDQHSIIIKDSRIVLNTIHLPDGNVQIERDIISLSTFRSKI